MIQVDVLMCLEDLRLMWDESSVSCVSCVFLSGTECLHLSLEMFVQQILKLSLKKKGSLGLFGCLVISFRKSAGSTGSFRL